MKQHEKSLAIYKLRRAGKTATEKKVHTKVLEKSSKNVNVEEEKKC